jgi:hypothetical protein
MWQLEIICLGRYRQEDAGHLHHSPFPMTTATDMLWLNTLYPGRLTQNWRDAAILV